MAAERSYPTSEVSGGREEPPRAGGEGWHLRLGAVAAWVQEGLEELSHIEGQERRQ